MTGTPSCIQSTSMFFKKRLTMVTVTVLALVLLLIAQLYSTDSVRADSYSDLFKAEYTLRDDATGGDCTKFGSWNSAAKTCTVTEDFQVDAASYRVGIMIMDDGITLDGNGFTLYSVGVNDQYSFNSFYGVMTHWNSSGVTIRNLVCEGAYMADFGWNSAAILVQGDYQSVYDNTLMNSEMAAIRIKGSYHGYVARNKISSPYRDNSREGIALISADYNFVNHNEISDIRDAVTIQGSTIENIISANLISNNLTGIEIYNYVGNDYIAGNTITANKYGISYSGWLPFPEPHLLIFFNHISGNTTQAIAHHNGAEFSAHHGYLIPGGNYWSDYDTPAEGCFDANGDGFCDNPYVFVDGKDSYAQSSTLPYDACGEDVIGKQVKLQRKQTYWASLADYRANRLSVDYKIDSFFDIWFDVTFAGAVNSGSVTTVTPAGHPPDPGHARDPELRGARAWLLTVKYDIPPGTRSFKSTVYVEVANNTCGTTEYYPGRLPRG